jgi:hypothetical protein
MESESTHWPGHWPRPLSSLRLARLPRRRQCHGRARVTVQLKCISIIAVRRRPGPRRSIIRRIPRTGRPGLGDRTPSRPGIRACQIVNHHPSSLPGPGTQADSSSPATESQVTVVRVRWAEAAQLDLEGGTRLSLGLPVSSIIEIRVHGPRSGIVLLAWIQRSTAAPGPGPNLRRRHGAPESRVTVSPDPGGPARPGVV